MKKIIAIFVGLSMVLIGFTGCGAVSSTTTPATTPEITTPSSSLTYDSGISYDELARTPDTYTNQGITMQGQVIQVSTFPTETDLRIEINDNPDDILMLGYNPNIIVSNVLVNDEISFQAQSIGVTTYTSTGDGQITIPAAVGYTITELTPTN